MLEIFNNELTNLPSEMWSLNKLENLNLHKNPLSGPFPEGLINLPALRTFNYSETDLCILLGRRDDLWLASLGYVVGNGLPPCTASVITTEGGIFSSGDGFVHYHFAADTFTDTVRLTYQRLFYASPLLAPGLGWMPFTATAVYSTTDQSATPSKPYTLTINYETLPVISDTVQPYYWNGTQWMTHTIHTIDTEQQLMTLVIEDLTKFHVWMVSGESEEVYLPAVFR